MSTHNPRWRPQLTVAQGMTFREKQEELEALGAAYKFFYLEGYLAQMSTQAPVDMWGTQELLMARGQRITASLSPAEQEIARMLSPRPDAPRNIPGASTWKRSRS